MLLFSSNSGHSLILRALFCFQDFDLNVSLGSYYRALSFFEKLSGEEPLEKLEKEEPFDGQVQHFVVYMGPFHVHPA